MDDVYVINVKKLVNTYLGLIFKIGVTAVVLTTLFFFANLTTDYYETPKFLVLLIFTAVLLILIALKFTVLGKVVFIRTPLDIPLLLLVVVATVSTFLSSAPYISLLGNNARVNDSLVSLVVLVLFYFVLVNSLRTLKEIRWIATLTIIAAQLLAVITLLSYAGIKVLPFAWTNALNFTPTGSAFSTTAILALLIPLVAMQIFNSSQLVIKLVCSLFLALMGTTIALTGSWPTWIAAIFGFSLSLINSLGGFSNLSNNFKRLNPFNLAFLVAPLVIVALVTTLSFIPPVGGAKNPLYTSAQNYPREIQLGFVPSWKISISAFRDSPFWGTGPSTYLFNFTTYKAVEFNSSKLWNLRFDSSFNEYLQTLANLGGVGLLALISLTALFVSSVWKTLMRQNDETAKALAVSGLAFFVLLALHPATLVLWVIGLLILASFMVVSSLNEGAKDTLSFTKGNIIQTLAKVTLNSGTSEETIKVDALPGVLLTIIVALVLSTAYFGGKFALADYHHRLALNAVAQNQGIVAYNELIAAEKLNPKSDLYRTDLAQINFALANAIAVAKGPTEASPAGSLTEQDKQNIQVLLQQSINEGRNATALNPRSPINWEILALLYRQISGVAQNALLFSLDSYGRAIMQDPLNPVLRVNVGGVYYAVQNYDMAIRFFTDAVNLKPDFANAYYNLSVALKDKGDLTNAQAMAEKTLTLIEDKNSQDYKTISDFVAELKKSNESKTQPPAAQTTGALQDENLPKLPVSGLENKPEKIATPAAIKKPQTSPTPIPSPTLAPTAEPTATP